MWVNCKRMHLWWSLYTLDTFLKRQITVYDFFFSMDNKQSYFIYSLFTHQVRVTVGNSDLCDIFWALINTLVHWFSCLSSAVPLQLTAPVTHARLTSCKWWHVWSSSAHTSTRQSSAFFRSPLATICWISPSISSSTCFSACHLGVSSSWGCFSAV